MAKKSEKINISAFEKAVKEAPNFQGTTVEWYGLELKIRTSISLNEMVDSVSVIYNSCFLSDEEYMPEAFDIALRCEMIEKYTNITLPSSVEKRYELIYGTNLLDIINTYADSDQVSAIIEAARNRINYKKAMNISKFEKRQNEILNTLENLQTQMEQVFGSISNDDIKSVLKAVSSAGIDESKLAEAIIKKKYKETDALS